MVDDFSPAPKRRVHSRFKVGDKVEFLAKGCAIPFGDVGVVDKIEDEYAYADFESGTRWAIHDQDQRVQACPINPAPPSAKDAPPVSLPTIREVIYRNLKFAIEKHCDVEEGAIDIIAKEMGLID